MFVWKSKLWFDGNSGFWVRSPGSHQNYALEMSGGGNLDTDGHGVDYESDGVRPALWISNLQSNNLHVETSQASKDESGTYIVTGDLIKVRNQASADSSNVYATLNKGDRVTVKRFYNDDWAVIIYEGHEAYISHKYIQKKDNTAGSANGTPKGGEVISGLPSREAEKKDNGWFYIDGNMQKNTWVYYRKYYYHVDGQGIIQKSQWIELRYVGADGRMYRGRKTPDGKWVGDDGLVVDVGNDLTTSLTIEAANPIHGIKHNLDFGIILKMTERQLKKAGLQIVEIIKFIILTHKLV